MDLNLTILGQIITFVMFIFFCSKYIWPPLISTIEKRQKEISDSINLAENAKKDFLKIKKESEDYLNNTKKQADLIILQANNKKEKIIQKAKEKAAKEYKKIISQAQIDINNKKRAIYLDLNKHIAKLVSNGIEKLIGNYINEEIDKKITEDLIDKL